MTCIPYLCNIYMVIFLSLKDEKKIKLKGDRENTYESAKYTFRSFVHRVYGDIILAAKTFSSLSRTLKLTTINHYN